MRRKLEPIGTRFGKWTLAEDRGFNRHKMTMVLARCDCGDEREVILANLRAGVSRSCNACARAAIDSSGLFLRSSTCRLKGDYIIEVKRRLSIGHARGQIARDYGVTWRTIDKVYKERTWAMVPWPNNWQPPWKATAQKDE